MNRECDRVQADLSGLLDGKLTHEEAARCREHLDGCPACRRRYEALAAVRELLRATPDPEPPEGLLSAIRTDAAMELRRPATIFERLRAPVLVAAAAAAVIAVVVLPRLTQPESSPQMAAELPETPAAVESPAAPQDAPAAIEEATGEPEPSSPAPAASALALVPPVRRAPLRGSAARPVSAAERPTGATEEPRVAYADTRNEATHLDAAGPVAPREGTGAPLMAAAPRTTRGGAEIAALPAAGTSRMETEVATGVVAGAVVEQFVAENLLEGQPAALAVITDTPTDLGPVIVDDGRQTSGFALCFTQSMLALSADPDGPRETSGFGLCFTQSMGRALAGTGN
ncbi:MAG: anti-sigma factor family protein [Armatimonadota bacterium]